ncbi:Nramp family divalent metal transporter [Robertkochia aurantiaca]|uniref:Nramp family divalent metal transporter n=1 Tax=Robertkochia aurantiaca TaxID=2873700 RepID=UPI001CCDD1CF|nr:Nramp family divalent metal transporter [Robertkochia sp. 3YJGBD-33]
MKDLIRKFGPGLLFAGAAIGVSHLVQSTRAGADFGFGLLWALMLSNLFKYPFFEFGPRYAMATGESLLAGYKRLGRPVLWAYFLMTFAVMFSIQSAVTIVTAGLAANLFGISADAITWSIIITLVSTVMLLAGRYTLLDRIMKVIILILTICTVTAVIMAAVRNNQPVNFEQVFPEEVSGVAFLIAFMGWMPAPLDISVWQSLWVREKNRIDSEYDAKRSAFDFNIGYISTVILGVFFVSIGALVMHQSGDTFENGAAGFAAQFISMYTEMLGDYAFVIIALAGFTAMFSTTLTTLDASPRAMAETLHLLTGKKFRFNYEFWLGLLAVGTVTILMFFLSEMATLIDIATIISFVTAPFFAIFNYTLVCSRHMPANAKPGLLMHILSISGIVFLTGFTVWYLFFI